eukprot:3937256-Rhodomonas_salina.4
MGVCQKGGLPTGGFACSRCHFDWRSAAWKRRSAEATSYRHSRCQYRTSHTTYVSTGQLVAEA